ncbi:MAG: hypothetical protein ABFC96_04305 [Thermoguttaceae bacterium]
MSATWFKIGVACVLSAAASASVLAAGPAVGGRGPVGGHFGGPAVAPHGGPPVGMHVNPGVGMHVNPGVGMHVNPGVGMRVNPGVGMHVNPGVGMRVNPGVGVVNRGFVSHPAWTANRGFVSPHVAFRTVGPRTIYNPWVGSRVVAHNNWWVGRLWARPGWRGWNRWWYYGSWWPWYSFGYGYPWYYGYSYPNYGYSYSSPYYSYDYSYPYAATSDVVPYMSDYGTDATYVPPAAETQPEAVEPSEAADQMPDFYSEALAAFQEGDFGNAVRLAGHAALDDPRNPDVHLLLSLGLFAMGQYRAAATEAHAVAALGETPSWPTVFRLYGKVEPYTEQLRSLEKFVREHPKASEGRFLLGFQYLVIGHRDAASPQLLMALEAVPQDRIAAGLLTKAGGTVPPNIAKELAKPPVMPGETPAATTARQLSEPPRPEK